MNTNSNYIHKSLKAINPTIIRLDIDHINQANLGNFNDYFKCVFAHELGHGHALGLDLCTEVNKWSQNIMAATCIPYTLDHDFIQRLAMLYKN